MWDKLVFGDPKIILDMARKTPHIIEEEHDCDCEYCDYDGKHFRCSKCWEEDEEIRYFKFPTGYKCPRCEAELMTPREYEDYVWAKERQYEPLLHKEFMKWND